MRTAIQSLVTLAVMLASSLVLLAGAASTAAAQPAVTASIAGGVESLAQSDAARVGGASAELEQTFAERLRLFYGIDAGTYAWPGDWGYALHRAGAVLHGRDAIARKVRMSVGAVGSWRLNGPSWETANYSAIGLFGDVESRPSAASVLRGWGRFDGRAFADLPDLDQREFSAGGSVLQAVQSTRTTLIGQVSAGRKAYAASDVAHQVTVLGRIAQNVTDTTGLTFQFTGRAIGGAVPPMLVETPGFFFEDGVYDDPYASTLRAWDAGVTRLLGRTGTIAATVSALRKDFGSLGRADTIRLGAATWEIPLLRSDAAVGLSVTPRYAYTHARSTSAAYTYTSHALGLGLTVSY